MALKQGTHSEQREFPLYETTLIIPLHLVKCFRLRHLLRLDTECDLPPRETHEDCFRNCIFCTVYGSVHRSVIMIIDMVTGQVVKVISKTSAREGMSTRVKLSLTLLDQVYTRIPEGPVESINPPSDTSLAGWVVNSSAESLDRFRELMAEYSPMRNVPSTVFETGEEFTPALVPSSETAPVSVVNNDDLLQQAIDNHNFRRNTSARREG